MNMPYKKKTKKEFHGYKQVENENIEKEKKI